MVKVWDYFMRRKPILVALLVSFLASSFFSSLYFPKETTPVLEPTSSQPASQEPVVENPESSPAAPVETPLVYVAVLEPNNPAAHSTEPTRDAEEFSESDTTQLAASDIEIPRTGEPEEGIADSYLKTWQFVAYLTTSTLALAMLFLLMARVILPLPGQKKAPKSPSTTPVISSNPWSK